MKATEAIRKIMESNGTKFTVLMGRLGIGSNVLANRLNQQNISIVKLNEMARVLDYKVILVPNDRRLKEDEFEVE